jgi:integrase
MAKLIAAVGRRTPVRETIVARERRSRTGWHGGEYLTETQIQRLVDTARLNRFGHRDATMIEVAFRHGLRAVELIHLRWNQIDFRSAIMNVRRVKGAWRAKHPSHFGRRGSGSAPSSARTKKGIKICVHIPARQAIYASRLCSHDRTRGSEGRV